MLLNVVYESHILGMTRACSGCSPDAIYIETLSPSPKPDIIGILCTINPKPLNLKPLNPKSLNPKPLNPKYSEPETPSQIGVNPWSRTIFDT